MSLLFPLGLGGPLALGFYLFLVGALAVGAACTLGGRGFIIRGATLPFLGVALVAWELFS